MGTGWGTAQGRELHRRLVALETKTHPLEPAELEPGRGSKRQRGSARWVKPELVAEVAFGEWTPDGHIRHASFRGVREDKPAGAITREQAAAPLPGPIRTMASITHPGRVVFDLAPGEGFTWPQLQEPGLQSWLKTSGGRGLHVVVPLTPRLDDDAVKAFSKVAVEHMARTIPQRFVAKSGAHWTVKTAREYLSFNAGSAPWADHWKSRQTLASAIKRLGG